jgi:ribosomal subunit interface protein
MNLQVSSDNMEVTESMKELARQKMEKLERRWQDIPDDTKTVRVVLNKAPEDSFLAKIEVILNGEHFYTEESGFELETAIVEAVEELDRMYLKQKEKKQESDWQEIRDEKTLTEEDLQEEL